MHKPSFIRSVKGKIIIAATLACFALFLAWSTSKDAFTGMLNAFEKVSAPNEKLRLVNDISRGIARLDQVQRARYIANPENNYASADSKDLVLKVDTLRSLYPVKSAQAERLESLKKLLEDRDRLFANYVKVRQGLIDNKSFSAQVDGLNTVLDQTAQQADSMVTTTEKKTSTTTVYPTATITDKKDTRGFFTRLFGKKRARDTIDSLSKPFQIVNEELAVKHDTLAKAIQDSLLKGLGQTMRDLEAMQQRKSAAFVNRETILIQSSSKIVKQIFSILKKIEGEVVAQTAENNAGAETMIHASIKRISLIMLGFVILAVLLVYFILRDISRINKYRQEIELAKDEAEYHAAAKQRFLSNMSHEIRTPLQSIIGYAEILKQEQRPKKKDIEAIYNSSAHLMQIVNEVLDYNRIISGKFSFASEVFNMQALLNEVITIMQLQADKKGLALTTNYDEAVSAFVIGDPFRLKQVLFNLLGNAIKFTQLGGVTLSVAVNKNDEKLRFHFDVTDTGIGMTAAEIGRIFYEFEQAGDEKQARTGTGLGLAITKELIESQGGTMKVKSKPGKGSSFIFDMEYVKTDEPLEDTEEKRPISIAGTGEKVWIIDDDPFILELCSRIFDINRIEYRCFTSPHEILAAADNTDVKCLLLDIRMPGMSGIELCNLLREKMLDDVMIYALTAQAVPGERENVLKAGFNGVLMKPFRESELLTLIKCAAPKKDQNDAPVFDLTAIEKMTFGDSSQTAKILFRFAEDSTNDIDELRLSLNNNDFDKSLLLLHRIAGRTAQAGARELAEKFRLAEIELRENGAFDAALIVDINSLGTQLEEIAAAARTYALNEENA